MISNCRTANLYEYFGFLRNDHLKWQSDDGGSTYKAAAIKLVKKHTLTYII